MNAVPMKINKWFKISPKEKLLEYAYQNVFHNSTAELLKISQNGYQCMSET